MAAPMHSVQLESHSLTSFTREEQQSQQLAVSTRHLLCARNCKGFLPLSEDIRTPPRGLQGPYWFHTVPLSCSFPALQPHWPPILQYARHTPAPGPLPLLFPLSGPLLSQDFAWLVPAQMSSPPEGPPGPLHHPSHPVSLATEQHSPLLNSYLFLHLFMAQLPCCIRTKTLSCLLLYPCT